MNNKIILTLNSKINDNMTNTEKYKVIYDYIVDNVKYDYSTLYNVIAYYYWRILYIDIYEMGLISEYTKRIANFSKLSGIDQMTKLLNNISNKEYRDNLIEELEKSKKEYENNNLTNEAKLVNKLINQANDEELTKKAILFIKKAIFYFKKEEEFKKNNITPKGNIFESGYGVCEDFSNIFKKLCDIFNLPCIVVRGHIKSNDCMLSHAWNAIVIDNEIKYIDLSGAIHSKDGTYIDTKPDDYFNKSYDELLEVDNGKNRTINDKSIEKISSLITTNKNTKNRGR